MTSLIVSRKVKLPFYRTIPEIRSDRPTLGSVMSYCSYDLFCVRSQLQALTPYTFEINSVEDLENEKMNTILTYTTTTNDEMKEEDVQRLANDIINLRSDYYPIWSYKTPFTKYRIWEQNVVVPIVESKFKSLGVVSVGGSLMLSLTGDDKLGNYIDIIETQTSELRNDLFKAIDEGWISCDLKFAKRWDFLPHITYDNVYVMRPQLSRELLLTDIKPCELLFSVYLYPDDCMVLPLRDPYNHIENKYDITRLCMKYDIFPTFMGDHDLVLSPYDINKINSDFILSILSYVPIYDENREIFIDYEELSEEDIVEQLKDPEIAIYRQLLKNDNKFFISTPNQK